MGNDDKIDRLIRQVTCSLKKTPDHETVYRDEPLLFTASQMKSYTPPVYTRMQSLLSGKDLLYKSGAEIFYKQGKFMETVEDDYPFSGSFIRFSPTYRELNLSQLRGYFSWRTKLRRGERPTAPLPFRFLYVYELLNLIGVSSPEEGYRALTAFLTAETDKTILRHAKPWLTDFVVYYGLDPSLLPPAAEQKFDSALCLLADPSPRNPDNVLDALCVFSSYNLKGSSFYKKHPEDTAAVVSRVFALLCERYRADSSRGIFERLFGRYESYRHAMFASAVFYEKEPHPDTVYEISPFYRFYCRKGEWTCERFFAGKDKAGKIGVLLKTVDCRMRLRYKEKNLLKPLDCPKIFTDAIDRAIEEYLKEKREKERPVVEIDRSLLQGIRSAADKTRDKLIVEEEPEETAPEPAPAPPEETGLTDAQSAVLRALLIGGDPAAAAKKHGQMLSLVVDSINDALWERFADTVIDYDGDIPRVIEDYESDLKGLLRL